MGSHKSGNHQPREQKSPDEKSRLYQFRLHPDNPDEAWAMERLEAYRKQGLSLRQWAVEAVALTEDMGLPVREVAVNAQDVLDIKDALQWLMEQLESGAFAGGGRRTGGRQKKVNVPQSVVKTLERYMGGGMVSDDDEYEDE